VALVNKRVVKINRPLDTAGLPDRCRSSQQAGDHVAYLKKYINKFLRFYIIVQKKEVKEGF